MAQLQKGTTFTNTSPNNQVTATNLNAHVDNAILLAGAITDQTSKASPVAADSVLVYSDADTALRKATIGSLPVTASQVTGTLPVANGGTGAATLTGYVKGAGTSALTASATIPTADLTGSVAVANGGTGAATAVAARVAINRGATALTDAATVDTDCSLGNVFTVTLGGNRTLGAPSNAVSGATYLWIVTQDGTGLRTLAFNAVFKFPGGIAPTMSTAVGAVDVITAVYNGTSFLASASNNFS